MLSLSIFSSSQRISVALYEGKLLKKSFEQKLINGKQNDSIFLLINKVLNKKKILVIFFFL